MTIQHDSSYYYTPEGAISRRLSETRAILNEELIRKYGGQIQGTDPGDYRHRLEKD